MEAVSLALAFWALALEATLLVRAQRGGFLSEFPFFFSYLAFVFTSSTAGLIVYFVTPRLYADAFWFCMIVMLVAEFAVILEGSDHIFQPYPSIRRLGRLITACICTAFLVVYIIPPFMQQRSSRVAIFDLMKRASLTKAVLIVILLAAARLFRLRLATSIAGLMLGFCTYLSLNISNIVLAESYSPSVYGKIFGVVGPLSFILALAIWNAALWRYEPVLPGSLEIYPGAKSTSTPLGDQLGRYSNELTRLLRK